MTKHALLSASSSHRWLNCPPSAKLCASFPNENTTYAQEGTDCHELCAYLVEKALGRDVQDPTASLSYYNEEMQNCAQEYCNYVMEQYQEAKQHCNDPQIMVEQRVDFSKYVPEGFGTGDCIIVADDILHVIDYKHGLGVLVEATNNPQLFCYALGALEIFDGLYDINEVKMTIFQPRKGNIDTFAISKTELEQWANDVLKPTAALAFTGDGEFKAGSHCQFCKVKATCRKRAEYNLTLAKYDFTMPATLDNVEIAAILPLIDHLTSWGNDVKDYALQQAQSGVSFDGYKLVEGRSNRKFSDETAVADIVLKNGYDPYDKKLMGITAMTSLLGKERFNELLGTYVYKPPGKPTLVPNSDKRPAMKTAKDEFNDNEGGK